MNMQAMLKQAQQLQKQMLSEQEAINNMTFCGETEFVKVTMKGSRKVEKVEIKTIENADREDFDMLEDMVMIAVNDAIGQIEKTTEQKLGKYTNGMPGLF